MYVREMQHKDIESVIRVSDKVMGEGFLTETGLIESIQKSSKNHIKNSLVAVVDNAVVGYLYMHAPGNWSEHKLCSPELWPSPIEKNAYFKAISVLPGYQGVGIGTKLSKKAIENAKEQGAENIIVHSWLDSPDSSSLRLMTKLGGKKIKVYEKVWYEDSLKDGWECAKCGNPCYCSSGEMYIPLK